MLPFFVRTQQQQQQQQLLLQKQKQLPQKQSQKQKQRQGAVQLPLPAHPNVDDVQAVKMESFADDGDQRAVKKVKIESGNSDYIHIPRPPVVGANDEKEEVQTFGNGNPAVKKKVALGVLAFLENDDLYNQSLVSKKWCTYALDPALWYVLVSVSQLGLFNAHLVIY